MTNQRNLPPKAVTLAWILFSLAGGLFVVHATLAQEKSLDEQLLDDLKPAPKPPSPTKPSAQDTPAGEKQKPDKSLDDALRRELERGEDLGQGKVEEHPLAKLGREMKQVQDLIQARNTAAGTQQLQKSIAADLASLIEQAKKQPQGNKSGDGNKSGSNSAQTGNDAGQASSQPGQQSTQRLEQGEESAAEMNEVRDALRRIWGHLPDKERDDMIGALGEQFLPKYERLLEAFYKRLAERPVRGP